MKNRLFEPAQPSSKRRRSQAMLDNLPDIDSDCCITLFGRKFLVVTRETRHWLSHDNLVSIGANPTSREFIICHPKEGRLNLWLQQFMQIHFAGLSHKELLEQCVRYVKNTLTANTASVDEIVTVIGNDPDQCYQVGKRLIPCVNISVFIDLRIGVCRHFNLLTALLIQALVDARLLPSNEIIYSRFSNSSGSRPPHALIYYETDSVHYTIDAIQLEGNAVQAEILMATRPHSQASDAASASEVDESYVLTQPVSYESEDIPEKDSTLKITL